MQTAKRHARNDMTLFLFEATDRATIAREQAALFPLRLALARMGRGCAHHLQENCSAHAPLRAAWFAQAQRNFQAWLDGGGFSQYDRAGVVNAGPSSTTDAQQDKTCID